MNSRRSEGGFTLIELLVVIVIIGILAGIAIPAYLRQREKAYRTNAVADMKNAATAVESWSTDNLGSYAGLNGITEADPQLDDEGFRRSVWVALLVTATDNDYCIRGQHNKLPGKEFVFRNAVGVVEVGAPGVIPC